MGSKKTTTRSTETATTTPNIAPYAQQPIQNYYNSVGSYASSDPYNFVTAPNALQSRAFDKTGDLFRSQDAFYTARMNTGRLMSGSTPTASLGNLGSPARAGSTGYNPQMTQAAYAGQGPSVSLRGYDVADLGPAQGYQASLADPVNLSDTARTVQAQSMLDNFQNYYNPATQSLVDTTLQGFDRNAEITRAQQAAQAARAGAFGGSRLAIREAETEGNLARERAAAEAGLRNTAFNNAAALSQFDTSNRQQAAMANQAAQNEREQMLASLLAQNSQFNAGAQNAAAAQFADANNNFALSRFGAENAANQFNAGAFNDAALANQAMAGQYGLANAGYQNAANLANADAFNNASQFGAAAANTANLANTAAQNEFGLANFAAQNQNNQFNAGLEMDNRAQQLAAANQYANIANMGADQYNADLQTQLELGNQLWQLQNQYTQAPLQQLQNVGSLLNPALLNQVSGQTINTSMNGTTTQPSGLLNSLLSAGASIGSAAIMASDIRVKRDIVKLGEEADGLGVYAYNYIWDDEAEPLRFGVMAQEVEALRPWALGPTVDGVMSVDYSKLGAN